MLDFSHIFKGNTPSDQRRFVGEAITHLKDRVGRIIIPCCGQFALATVAIKAGIEPAKIECSDISLFSTLLGTLYAGRGIKELPLTLSPQVTQDVWAREGQIQQAACLLWWMKWLQIRGSNQYEAAFKENLLHRKEHYVALAAKQIEDNMTRLAGIKYEVGDLRTALAGAGAETDLVLLNPPVFPRGYEKMFDFGQEIQWSVDVPEFRWSKEYHGLWEAAQKSPALHIWYRAENLNDIDHAAVLFAKEFQIGRCDYLITNQPAAFEGMESRMVAHKSAGKRRVGRYPILPSDYVITDKARITFKKCTSEVADYYRDLFVHKMGRTPGNCVYILILIDGHVFGITGISYAYLLRRVHDDVFEMFGMSFPLKRYHSSNRLLMMAITTETFRAWLEKNRRINRIWPIKGFRTVCVTKYRKQKTNTGLLTLIEREKLDIAQRIINAGGTVRK